MKTSIGDFCNEIDDEFFKIRKQVQTHLKNNNDIERKKIFLSDHIPKEVILSSDLLLDTVINALMDDAKFQLNGASTEVQNKFYIQNFREKVKSWTVEVEYNFKTESRYVKFSRNPQMVNGLIASGSTFIAGATITSIVFFPRMVIGSIVSGIITLILSAAAFKLTYDKSEPEAISKMSQDIDDYLESSKSYVSEWIDMVIISFKKEFNSFCINNGMEVK